jgi:deoxycytidylate deaminase
MVTDARFGHGIQYSTLYTTLQPCFTCTKEFLQAKIKTVYYLNELDKTNSNKKKTSEEKDFNDQYHILLNRFEKHPSQVDKNQLLASISNMKRYLTE